MIGGTRGGFNRARIIQALRDSPQNAFQLTKELEADYSTIRHHVEVMEKNGLVTSLGEKYGKMYFVSDQLSANMEVFEEIWERIGKKKIKGNEAK